MNKGGIPALVRALACVALEAPVFISDLHLCAQRPKTLRAFARFLEALPAQARELVILGDLFEYWSGDDALAQPAAKETPDDRVAREVAQALRALAARGVAVYIMRGNRDLLLGAGFLHASRARLLADPALARLGTGAAQSSALLAHGDAYCTLDTAYQGFRRRSRNPILQAGFLFFLSLEKRRRYIGQARSQSESGKQQRAAEIMDVTPEAVVSALRSADTRRMIHGHTHRPACHALQVDGAAAERWVLPDWDCDTTPARGGGLLWHAGELRPVPVEAAPSP